MNWINPRCRNQAIEITTLKIGSRIPNAKKAPGLSRWLIIQLKFMLKKPLSAVTGRKIRDTSVHRLICSAWRWARQTTQSDFQIAEEISGVNMRLIRVGIRELHWHQAAEWAYVTNGAVRVTTIDTAGRANVEDVGEGGL